ncbi:hypothetical protein PpBr36_02696 [Pyricularia pennisetigena]|uniref:hypothetical protein n=1 Tax=Pyricularia pennisetigena TaxID=1578925 RepID=UPI001154B2B1|nr:hypothetical protein PpBr36_02696 [Pyricularia pennisetigena]TLS30477.1 hypothetical protein PpBr36_02696 [Pyricularia pennisetigena]
MQSISIIMALSSLAAAGPVMRRQAQVGQPLPNGPFAFTSTYNLVATPDKVINNDGQVAPGETGAIGFYNYGINVDLDIICYNITLMGVTGPYQSPATTATHIHEAAEGAAGPPRISFPNPEPADSGPEVVKRSSGCLTGPFITGIQANGQDTGTGFTLRQIEANPAGFFTDSHTVKSVPGVVRAQMVATAAGAVAAPAAPAAAPPAPVAGAVNAAPAVNQPSQAPDDLGGCSILGFQVASSPLKYLCFQPGFGSGAAAPAAPAAPVAANPVAAPVSSASPVASAAPVAAPVASASPVASAAPGLVPLPGTGVADEAADELQPLPGTKKI